MQPGFIAPPYVMVHNKPIKEHVVVRMFTLADNIVGVGADRATLLGTGR